MQGGYKERAKEHPMVGTDLTEGSRGLGQSGVGQARFAISKFPLGVALTALNLCLEWMSNVLSFPRSQRKWLCVKEGCVT